MNIFSVDFTHNELNFIRQSLDTVSIQGRDAKFLANLQIKLENELQEIHNMLNSEVQNKQVALQVALQEDAKKSSKKSNPSNQS
jgi:hypothetical protein